MKCRAREVQYRRMVACVQMIGDERMPDMREVNAQLMRAPCFRKERKIRIRLALGRYAAREHLPIRDRGTAIGFFASARVPASRLVATAHDFGDYPPALASDMTIRDRTVFLVDATRFEFAAQVFPQGLRPCYHQDAARRPVEPMDEPADGHSLTLRRYPCISYLSGLGVPLGEPRGDARLFRAAIAMTDEPRRLVEDEIFGGLCDDAWLYHADTIDYFPSTFSTARTKLAE